MYATCNTIHGRSTCDYVETYSLWSNIRLHLTTINSGTVTHARMHAERWTSVPCPKRDLADPFLSSCTVGMAVLYRFDFNGSSSHDQLPLERATSTNAQDNIWHRIRNWHESRLTFHSSRLPSKSDGMAALVSAQSVPSQCPVQCPVQCPAQCPVEKTQ